MKRAKKQIFNYLDRNYIINSNRFFDKVHEIELWAEEIINEISFIFSFDNDLSKKLLLNWSISNGMDDKCVDFNFNKKLIKFKLSASSPMKSVVEELYNKTNSLFLKDSMDLIKTIPDLKDAMNCLGYDLKLICNTKMIGRDVIPFTQHAFEPVNLNVLKDKRENNPIWLNWIGENL